GMNRLRARLLGGVQDPLLVEIALSGRAAADQIGLVRARDVRRTPVDLRVDADRSDPQLTERPEDTDRDLTPVGDEYLCENGHCPSYSLVSEPSGRSDRCARRLGPFRHLALRLEFPGPQLLGHCALRRRNGDGVVRRQDRAESRVLLAARLA